MKITLESTTTVIQLQPNGGGKSIAARLWQGKTDKGIPCHAFIPAISPTLKRDQQTAAALDQFERELIDIDKHVRPDEPLQAIPLRFFID